MNQLILRISALIAHAACSIVILTIATSYDITLSWISVALFFGLAFILLVLFLKHMFSFIAFLKTKTK